MENEFRIPLRAEDLLSSAVGATVCVADEIEIGTSAEAVELAERTVSDLRFNDAPSIIDQEVFDSVYALVRNFNKLPAAKKSSLLGCLHANLTMLSASTGSLLSSSRVEIQTEGPTQRSALKAYVFFLNWAWMQIEEAPKPETPAPGRRGRKSVGSAQRGDFNRVSHFEGTIKALVSILSLDLERLFLPSPVDQRMLTLCLNVAIKGMAWKEAMRTQELKKNTLLTVALCACQYKAAPQAASELVQMAQKNENLEEILGQLLQVAENTQDEDSLTSAVITEITKSDPDDLSQQWESTKGKSLSVKSMAKLIEAVAASVPHSLKKMASLVEPYWNCSAYPVRNALVTASCEILLALKSGGDPGNGDDQRIDAMLHLKQHMLDRLIERFRDKSAFTRSRVMMMWITLVQNKAVPVGHYIEITKLAIGRLADLSATCRKSAISLLLALVEYNPFGSTLSSNRFKAALEEQEAKLAEIEGPLKEAVPEGREGSLPAVEENEEGSQENHMGEANAPGNGPSAESNVNQEQLRTLIASLKAVVEFTGQLKGCIPKLRKLLGGSSVQVVQEAIAFVTVCKKFELDGIDAVMKHMMALIFSTDASLRKDLLEALMSLHIQDDPVQTARSLIALTIDASVGELECLEQILLELLDGDRCKIEDEVLSTLLLVALKEDGQDQPDSPRTRLLMQKMVRGVVQLLTFSTPKKRSFISKHIDVILQIAFYNETVDGRCVAHVCRLLKELGPEGLRPDNRNHICSLLVKVVLDTEMPDLHWLCAGERAIDALYHLFPKPEMLAIEILLKMAHRVLVDEGSQEPDVFPSEDGQQNGGALQNPRFSFLLARFLFVLGHTPLQHMQEVEAYARIVRQQKMSESNAPENGPPDSAGNENVSSQLGVGGAAAMEIELDNLFERVESEVLQPDNIIGNFAPVVSALCSNIQFLLSCHPSLRAASVLAMSKFMMVDKSFCDMHLRLFFTLLQNRQIESGMRKNLAVALGDLNLRFPNLLEPWMPRFYRLLEDTDAGVRYTCLMVLTHLILSDMVKVKGHISRVVVLLEDPDVRISSMTASFFNQLSQKVQRNSNPIYNLLPDILSNLVRETSLSEEQFQRIMQHLLQYTNEKHGDRLVEKIVHRMEGESNACILRGLAFSLRQLSMGEKGIEKFMELFKQYRHALGDDQVLQHFKELVGKLRRSVRNADLRTSLVQFEEQMESVSEEVKAEIRAMQPQKQEDIENDMEDEQDFLAPPENNSMNGSLSVEITLRNPGGNDNSAGAPRPDSPAGSNSSDAMSVGTPFVFAAAKDVTEDVNGTPDFMKTRSRFAKDGMDIDEGHSDSEAMPKRAVEASAQFRRFTLSPSHFRERERW